MVNTFDTARIMDKLDMPSRVEVDTRVGVTGDARFAPIPVDAANVALGSAIDPRSYPPTEYLVTAQKLDRPWPGTNQGVTFAVERMRVAPDGRRMTDFAVGFFSERECWEYLTGTGTMRATVYDLRGVTSDVDRSCLGVPEGFTDRHAVTVASGPIPSVWICDGCGLGNDLGTTECADCGQHCRDSAAATRDEKNMAVSVNNGGIRQE